VTAGVGSDHVDLNAANKRKITVAEVSGSNVVSVAEHVVMTMLCLIRNFVPAHEQIINHKWNVAQIARDAYDLEGKVVGTIGCGRIGYRVLQRLEAFDCKELLWFDYNDIPAEAAKAISAKRVDTLDELLSRCDVITVNCPLHESTKGLINAEAIKKMKKGAWIVNTARGAICDRKAIVDALESGHIAGYGGDVWDVQPAPADHPWRDMRAPNGNGNASESPLPICSVSNEKVTPHYSGTTLDAQARYAAGTKEIIDNYLQGKPQNPANVIVENGGYATKAYGQRK
jgi:formate dehydrogenase